MFAHSSMFSNKYVTIGRKRDYMSKYKTTMYIVSTRKTMTNRLNQSLKVLMSQLLRVCEGNDYFQHLYTRRIVLHRFSSIISSSRTTQTSFLICYYIFMLLLNFDSMKRPTTMFFIVCNNVSCIPQKY